MMMMMMMVMVMVTDVDEYISDNQGHTKGGAAKLQTLPPNKTPQNRNLKDRFCRYYNF
jgi:hypothetical protein